MTHTEFRAEAEHQFRKLAVTAGRVVDTDAEWGVECTYAVAPWRLTVAKGPRGTEAALALLRPRVIAALRDLPRQAATSPGARRE